MHEVGAGPDLDRMMLDGFGEPCNETGPSSSGFGPSLDLEALERVAHRRTEWIWHGYLAAGAVTLLTSQWKSGKTTLVSVLLSKMAAGGGLAGLAVERGGAIVLSEEGADHWVRRSRLLDLRGPVRWYCRPFAAKPSLDQWRRFLRHLRGECVQHHTKLVVVDTLAAFLPGRDENNAGSVLEGLMPLHALTAPVGERVGPAVLLLHHPRKGETGLGQAARGSGALAGFADILVEMRWYSAADERDRRRRLSAWSRQCETPPQLVIELNQAGTDYAALGDYGAVEFAARWEVLRTVFEGAACPLTRREILQRWPSDYTTPDDGSLWRWLDTAVEKDLIVRTGAGRRGDPFQYHLTCERHKAERDSIFGPNSLDDPLAILRRE